MNTKEKTVSPAEEFDFLSAQKTSQFKETFLRLCQNKAAVAGMIFLIFLIFLAVFADVLFDYQTTCVDLHISERLQWPSAEHWFGTDEFGRDLLARVVHGSRVSLSIGLISTGISATLGLILGSLAGFYGNKVDNIIMRTLDVFHAIPSTLLAIAISSALGGGIINAMIAVEILQERGAQIEVAENGKIAEEKFAASPAGYYDAVLMDVQMPVMDGRAAARSIRAMPRPDAQRVPIYALSADAFVEDERLSREAGMNGHLSKPVNFDELWKILQQAVQEGRQTN